MSRLKYKNPNYTEGGTEEKWLSLEVEFAESDPVFKASAAANITTNDIDSWNGKSDKLIKIEHGTNDTTFELTPNVYHVWGAVNSLTLTLAIPSNNAIYNEYMFEFTSSSSGTTLSLPSNIQWVSEPNIEANKVYQCSIVGNIGIIVTANLL